MRTVRWTPCGWLGLLLLMGAVFFFLRHARLLALHSLHYCNFAPTNTTLDTLQSMVGPELDRGFRSPNGDYVMHHHAWPATNTSSSSASVCLATFCSVNRLHWLPWLLRSWSGPISVAVFAPGADYVALVAVVRYFKRCHPSFESTVSVHVLYPQDRRPEEVVSNIDISELSCGDPEDAVDLIMQYYSNSASDKLMKLPQNLLRNMARRSCDSDFSLVIDIDMIPAPLMFERLSLLLEGKEKLRKCALIVPVYEIMASETSLPATKLSLLQLLEEHKAQQYHIEVYEKNQGNSNLKFWEKASKSARKEAVFWSLDEESWPNISESLNMRTYKEIPYRDMYRIQSYEEFWEPIVVLPYDAPSFDERFFGFGFCRNSLVYELHVRGFNFRMLDEAFLCHWGFQTRESYPAHRLQEIKENSVRYEAFKRELLARYTLPPTPRQTARIRVVPRPGGKGRLPSALRHMRM